MNRFYKTKSGTYSETDLVVVVWRNPKKNKRPQSRFLETMCAAGSPYPLALPYASLNSNKSWKYAKKVNKPADFDDLIEKSTREAPLLLDLPLAGSILGWKDFYIPDEYTEEDLKR